MSASFFKILKLEPAVLQRSLGFEIAAKSNMKCIWAILLSKICLKNFVYEMMEREENSGSIFVLASIYFSLPSDMGNLFAKLAIFQTVRVWNGSERERERKNDSVCTKEVVTKNSNLRGSITVQLTSCLFVCIHRHCFCWMNNWTTVFLVRSNTNRSNRRSAIQWYNALWWVFYGCTIVDT